MIKGDRGPRPLKSPPKVGFTQVEILGLNGAGWLKLSTALVYGPFAPGPGDQVVRIEQDAGFPGYALSTPRKFDDSTGFASEVDPRGRLRQHDAGNLSAITLTITFARVR